MIGIDTVKISRMAELMTNRAFMERVFTAAEREYCDERQHPAQSYAGVFCVKEAAVKAVGRGFGTGIMPIDIEVTHAQSGAPILVFHGTAAEIFDGYAASVSISHDGDHAVAAVELMLRGV